ncbi:GerAB/ArcD/ProY family transporter [Paenibacillus chondroitinus]|uniref:GerAB/ArcD/ProY family transporter n=1 Tax=Paenibacillus chondroitinus TaxID=59842 RepID=A0ABU6DEV6_9BACL|nr:MULTISPECIES: GerAB/ArcD/ProY family transporter [Paenibacillus]MCY9661511.1 spore germination protein [Paenibacillus anseongense]MEB4796279.1 GerAB/ArcD/ProY family transporter [Paenibacillus chondroitinus]
MDKGVIGIRQFTILVILLTLGDSILILPSSVAGASHQDAWISGLLGTLFGLISVWIYAVLGGLYPGLSLIQYTPLIAGKWLGAVLNISFLIFFAITVVVVTWEIGDFFTSMVLPDTPIEVLELLFYGLLIFAVRLGIGTIIRASEIFFPWIMLIMFTLIVLLVPQMEISRIQPILEEGMRPVLLGSLPATFLPCMEIFCLLILIPHVKESKKLRKNFFIGAIIGCIGLNVVVAQCILVLGQYFTVNMGAQFIKLKTYKMLTVPTAMICFCFIFIALPNTASFKSATKVWGYYDISICMVIPLLLIGLYFIRKNKLKHTGSQSPGEGSSLPPG